MKTIGDICISLLIVILLSLVVSGQHNRACKSTPISVDTINSCVDNVCKANVVVSGAVSFGSNNKICLELQVGSIVIGEVNITLLDSYRVQSSDNCYYTGQPNYRAAVRCGCAGLGGESMSCSSCSTISEFQAISGDKYCTESTWAQPGRSPCALVDSGTYCAFMYLTGNGRYKVCHLNQPGTRNIFLDISTPIEELHVDYKDTVSSYISSNNNLNFTVLSTASTDPTFNEYIVYDNTQMNDYHYLSSAYVNNNYEYYYTKIGWYKYGRSNPAGNTFQNQIRWEILCKDSFLSEASYTTDVADITQILSGTSQYQATKLPYRVQLFDNDFNYLNLPSSSDLSQNYSPFWYIKTGVMSVHPSSANRLSFVGISNDNSVIPFVFKQVTKSITLTTNNGDQTWDTSIAHCDFVKTNDDNEKCIQVCIIRKNTDSIGTFGFGTMNSCEFDQTKLVPFTKTNNQLTIVRWPDMKPCTHTFGSQITISCPSQPSPIYVKVGSLSTEVIFSLSMNNVTVTFKSNSIMPEISNCNQKGNQIFYDIKSISYPGTVLVFFSDPTIYSSNPSIGLQKQTFSTVINSNYDKEITVYAQNGDYVANCKLQIKYNSTWNINGTSGQTTGFQNFLNSISPNIGPLVDGYSEPVQVVIVLSIILGIGLVVFVLIFLLVLFIRKCCCSRKTKDETKPTKTKTE